MFAADLVSCFELGFSQGIDFGNECLVFGFSRPSTFFFPQRFARFAHQLVDGVDGNIALLVAKDDTAQHHFFVQLLGFRFDHQNGGFCTSNNQIHFGFGQFGFARVEHILLIDVAHARRADRARKWNARDSQGCAGGDQSRDVAFDLRVERECVDDHLHFVHKAFWEQRANRAVDQTAGQGFKFAGAAFALEEAARDFAGCVGFLKVVHRQWEKVLTRFG